MQLTLIIGNDVDLTDNSIDTEVGTINLQDKTVTLDLSQAAKTIIKGGSNGNYVIKDTAANIATYGAINGVGVNAAAADAAKFSALYGASEIQIKGWNTATDLSAIGLDNSSVAVAAGKINGFTLDTTIRTKLLVEDGGFTDGGGNRVKKITAAMGAKLTNIDEISVLGNNNDISIDNDNFTVARKATHLAGLDAITAAGSGTDITLSKVANAATSETDLKNIETITGLNSIKVEADTAGVDIVQLSSALSTSGKVTIDLKASDDKVDKLIFNVDKSNYLSTGSDTISYTTVNNFDANSDQYGLYYTGFSGEPAAGTYGIGITRSTVAGGSFNAPLLADKTYVEDDANAITGTKSDFDTVTEVKGRIGSAIAVKRGCK